MRVSRDLYVRGDIGQFIDNVLDSVDWVVDRDDLARIKYFKPMSGVYDFGDDYENSIERYRGDVAIFNNYLRSKEAANRLEEAITELGSSGVWINDKSLSDMTDQLFGKRISVSYMPKLIARHGYLEMVNSYNVGNHGTSNEKTKETVRVIMEAANRLEQSGRKVSKVNIALESEMHLRTIQYQFKNVEVLTQNVGL